MARTAEEEKEEKEENGRGKERGAEAKGYKGPTGF